MPSQVVPRNQYVGVENRTTREDEEQKDEKKTSLTC